MKDKKNTIIDVNNLYSDLWSEPEKFEEYLHSKGYKCIQTQCVLVKDFYKPLKQKENVLQVFLFGENGIATE